MKYGAMNFPIKPILNEIKEIGELDFDYIEISVDAPEATPEKILEKKNTINELLQNYNLEVIGHLPTFVSTSDLYETIRKASIIENFKALEVLSDLGVKKAVLHPGYITGLAKFVFDKSRKYAIESIKEILEKAKEFGIKICLENMFSQSTFLANPQDFKEIFDLFPEIFMTLDVGHANLDGGKNRSIDFINSFPTKIAHIHMNDNFGKEDNHLPIGAGIIDFVKILRELKSIQYDDTITIEVFSKDRDYLRISKDKLKGLWEKL
jgi:sugar phosphate isomerase/epimerase